MTLKLYYDLMSQPSRALYILLNKIKFNFEPKVIDLRRGEHYTDEFSQINRMQKVPVIDHNGFILTESVAILKYLSREGVIPESLYPKENKLAARVEEFLEWQHAGLRLHCAMYFRVAVLNPAVSGKPVDPQNLAGYERRMVAALEEFDTKWLGRGHSFVVGDAPTVADLQAACEIEQPRMAGYDPMEKFSNIGVWMKKVRDHFNPHYEEAHVTLNKIVSNKQTAKASSKI